MITTLPTLYSRTSHGRIEQWTIQVEGANFYTTSGQYPGGKLTESLPTVCSGKNLGRSNATTAEQQAVMEAQAKWDKKRKTGYWEDPADVDKFYFVEPTLATPLDNVKGGLQFPCLVQCKYNGGCIIADARGLWSRKGERYVSIPHIEEALVPFFIDHPHAILHGEAFNEELREQLNELMSILRTTKPEKLTPVFLARSREVIEFFVYDGYCVGDGIGEATPYSIRKFHIDQELRGERIPYCRWVPTHVCQVEAEVWQHYDALLAAGHEGAIVRYPDSPYEHKRTKQIIKLKPCHDAEAEILAVTEGTGNWTGTGKVFTLRWNGKEFDATLKGNMEQGRQVLTEKHQWIGRTVTFLYTSLTGLGVPHAARVDYGNCFKS